MTPAFVASSAMESDRATQGDAFTDETGGPRLPEVVDWIASALVALAGLALVLGGAAVLFVVDRPEFAEALAEGTQETTVLTEAEFVDVALTTGTWTGGGLLVAGGALVVVAVAYVLHRRRTHRRAEAGESTNDFLANAVVGAVVSTVLGFVPFSPAVGGAVAGYFERGQSERVVGVGTLSGVLAAGPLLVVVGFVSSGLAVGLFTVQQAGLATVVLFAALFSLMVMVTVGAALGAIGGYVGGRLAEE